MSPTDQANAALLLRTIVRNDYADPEEDSGDPLVRITALRRRQDDMVCLLELLCRAKGITP